jgi:LPPG:FO 2-phospho-L-lactate transferase
MTSAPFQGSVVALCGGVGGAKLALGLSRVLAADQLSVVINTADDFEHFGLAISPDIDTVTYTLAGRVNPATGWGLAEEGWRFMAAVGQLGGETWFNLGDTDLATHGVRTAALAAGATLTEVTARIALALGVKTALLPVTDDPIRTIVETDEGTLPFQRYFVGRKCEPAVRALRYDNADASRPTREVVAALSASDLGAIILCPSNPFLSIDPILAVPGVRELIARAGVPVIAISPIIGGRSIKGPLAKMMAELGIPVDARSIAAHYDGLVDVLIVDDEDASLSVAGPQIRSAKTLMTTLADREGLALATLAIAGEVGRKTP